MSSFEIAHRVEPARRVSRIDGLQVAALDIFQLVDRLRIARVAVFVVDEDMPRRNVLEHQPIFGIVRVQFAPRHAAQHAGAEYRREEHFAVPRAIQGVRVVEDALREALERLGFFLQIEVAIARKKRHLRAIFDDHRRVGVRARSVYTFTESRASISCDCWLRCGSSSGSDRAMARCHKAARTSSTCRASRPRSSRAGASTGVDALGHLALAGRGPPSAVARDLDGQPHHWLKPSLAA